MNNLPKMALLVPVFNGEKYIDKFCTAVRSLKIKFDEVIFYNDGSTDNTLNLLMQSGFRYLSSGTNNGVGYARNILAKAAESEYVHFHDIDDEFHTSFIQLIHKAIQENAADVIFGNADWLDNVSRKILIQWKYNQQELLKNPLTYFLENPLGIINSVYKKEKFLSINGFDEEISCWEDADLHIKLAAAGAKFRYLDKVLAFSIRHDEGLSSDQLRCWNCRLQFIERYIKEYRNLITNNVLESEVKKVQNVFIKSGQFCKLKLIIDLKKKYNLRLSLKKIYPIYLIDKILPSRLMNPLINKFIKSYR